MNSEEFIENLRIAVREPAIEDTLANLESPPGRRVPDHEKSRAEWFKSLPEKEKELIGSIVEDAVDEALFGFLCVIDGVRKISDEGGASFIFKYKGAVEEALNDPDKIGLHDLYNSP